MAASCARYVARCVKIELKLVITKREFQLSLQFSLFSRKLGKTLFQETKQAKLHLHFAPKIIKIRSVALENELIEVAPLVPKILIC